MPHCKAALTIPTPAGSCVLAGLVGHLGQGLARRRQPLKVSTSMVATRTPSAAETGPNHVGVITYIYPGHGNAQPTFLANPNTTEVYLRRSVTSG